MKVWYQLSLCLALCGFLNIRFCQSIPPKVASVITNIIFGNLNFDQALWKILKDNEVLGNQNDFIVDKRRSKSYNISEEILPIHDNMMKTLEHVTNKSQLKKTFKFLEKEFINIEIVYNKMINHRLNNKFLKEEDLTFCLEILELPKGTQLKSIRKILYSLTRRVKKNFLVFNSKSNVRTVK